MLLKLAGLEKLPAFDTAHVRTVPNATNQEISLELGHREPGILIGQQHLSAFNIKRIHLLEGGGEIFATALGAAMSGPLAPRTFTKQAHRNKVITTLIASNEQAAKSAEQVTTRTEVEEQSSVQNNDLHSTGNAGHKPNIDLSKEVVHYTVKWPVGGATQDLPRSRVVYRCRSTALTEASESDSVEAGGDGPCSAEPTVDRSYKDPSDKSATRQEQHSALYRVFSLNPLVSHHQCIKHVRMRVSASSERYG